MTHYLRLPENIDIVDIEQIENNFYVVIDITAYSAMLLAWLDSKGRDVAEEFVITFARIQELRGEWFEKVSYFDKSADLTEWLKKTLGEIAAKWKLTYVID